MATENRNLYVLIIKDGSKHKKRKRLALELKFQQIGNHLL